MSNSSKKDSLQSDPAPPNKDDPKPSAKRPKEATKKNTLVLQTSVQPVRISDRPKTDSQRKNTQYMSYGVTPVPSVNKSDKPPPDSPTKITPILPSAIEPKRDSNRVVGVPIKRISDKPSELQQVKRDSNRPISSSPKRDSDKAPASQPGRISDTPLAQTATASGSARESPRPPKPAESPSAKATVSIRPVSVVRGAETSQRPAPQTAQPSLTAATTPAAEKTVSLSQEPPKKTEPVTDAAPVKKDEKAKRPRQYSDPVVFELYTKKTKAGNETSARDTTASAIPRQTIDKAIYEQAEPMQRSGSALYRAKWIAACGCIFITLAAVYYWNKVETAVKESVQTTKDVSSAKQPALPNAQASRTTEIITNPPGAELIFQGSVIANTPAKVERSPYEQLILLRKTGYEPTLVRVSPESEEVIHIELRPSNEGTPVPKPDTKM